MTRLIKTKKDLFSILKEYIPLRATIVEAGAFNGTDTFKMSKCWRLATIHAFEPVPEIFTLLQAKTVCRPRVKRYQYALSNTTGSKTFFVSEKPSRPGKPFQAGSLLRPTGRLQWSDAVYNETIAVSTITLDDWACKYGVTIVDFLWLDMQGHELAVLQASPKIVSTVSVVYMEVSFVHGYAEQPLYDEIYAWMNEQGFVLAAKDFSDQPKWFFGNALFVRKVRPFVKT